MAGIQEKNLYTDVLVVGAGGAGLRAAIAAAALKVGVLVVSKGQFPEGSNSAAAGGAMHAPIDKHDSPARYLMDTLKAGDELNYYPLAKLMAEHAADRVSDLEHYKAGYKKESSGFNRLPANDGSARQALLFGTPYSGDWLNILTTEAARRKITIHDRLMITGLLQRGTTVIGAVGLEIQTKTVVVIYAKSVILTTGGAGNLYRFTTNVPGLTGDGLIMALLAGATLSHLEFVQMRQCIIHPVNLKGKLPPFDGFITAGGRFYNGLHERFMQRYHPEKRENVTRAEIAKCAQLEINAGRQSPHGGVYGDLSDVPPQLLMQAKEFATACKRSNFDPTYQCFEWAPASHHTMGGVVINSSCQTGVPGLFAAGEVTAGIQGANRTGGNALTETQVFGAIAGAKAAERAIRIPPPTPDQSDIAKARGCITAILATAHGRSCEKARTELRELISRHLGTIRHQDGLLTAKTALTEMGRTHLHNLSPHDNSLSSVAEILEFRNMHLLAELITQAALIRTESRGAHQRQDYPETSYAWKRHILFRRSPTGFKATLLPAISPDTL